MPHALRVAALPRLLLVVLLALGVLAMHHVAAPAQVHSASADGHAIHAPAQPVDHDRGEHEDGGHHGWIGLCLAVVGTGLVVLLMAGHLRPRPGRAGGRGRLARHLGRLHLHRRPPPTPSLLALCVMRT